MSFIEVSFLLFGGSTVYPCSFPLSPVIALKRLTIHSFSFELTLDTDDSVFDDCTIFVTDVTLVDT